MESTSLILRLSLGEPAFLLAYGSGKFMWKTSFVQNDEILSALLEKPMTSVIQRVQLLEKGELGGKDALQLSAGSLPWKKWTLWFVLIAGVAYLSYMVRNLLSELKDQKCGPNGQNRQKLS